MGARGDAGLTFASKSTTMTACGGHPAAAPPNAFCPTAEPVFTALFFLAAAEEGAN